MKKVATLVAAASLFFVAGAQAQPAGIASTGSSAWLAFWSGQNSTDTVATESTVVRPEGWKSPRKALLLSAVVPGLGEFYAGSKWKTPIFLGAEVAGFVMYFTNTKKGDEKTDEFEAFADAHWSEQEYWEAVAREAGLDPNDIDALREYEAQHFSHSLHREKDQQYYEMIGKYDQFNAGWDDTDTHRGRDSKHRLEYEDMRAEANSFYKKATTGVTIVMVNHVLSAIDAAWTTVYHNNKLATASLRASGLVYNNELVPMMGVQVDW